MRFLIGLASVVLVLIGGFFIFDGIMASVSIDNVLQQISNRIQVVGGVCTAGIGLITFSIAYVMGYLSDISKRIKERNADEKTPSQRVGRSTESPVQ